VEKIREALRSLTHQTVSVRIDLVSGGTPPPRPKSDEALTPKPTPAVSRRKELMQLPLFKKAADVLGAQLVMDDPEFNPSAETPVLSEQTAPEIDLDEV